MASLTVNLPLSETDRELLEGLLGVSQDEGSEASPPASEPTGGAKPRKTAQKKAETPSEPDEDPVDELDIKKQVKDAVAKASVLLKDGKQEVVKNALDTMELERVGHMKTQEQVDQFLALLGE